MKRFTLVLLMIAAMMNAVAEHRSVEEAAVVAGQFLTANNGATHRVAANEPLKLVYTHAIEAQEPAMYVFARGEENGYVIVSGDDRARAVLAYSDQGWFDEANMPPAMRMMLNNYAEQIAWLQGKSMPAEELDPSRGVAVPTTKVEKQDLSGAKLMQQGVAGDVKRAPQAASSVSPLLGGIIWDQGSPYNNLCPADPASSSQKCYTGCVATGISQVMRYHQHPTKGSGSHSYTWESGNKTLSANFGNTTYDWANMKESYLGSSTTAQKTAVATLMYHVGVSCDMNYGGASVGGSGANTKYAISQLPVYFGYDQQMYANMPDYQGQAAFEDAVREELSAGRPLVMSGRTVNNEGHCFVCDGYNANGLFHINWGWSGNSNDYFVMSALDPYQQGAGGAASGEGFRLDVAAISGIRPNAGGSAWPQLGLGALEPSVTTVQLGQNFSINLGRVMNVGLSTINGTLYVGLFQNGSRKDYIGVMNISDLGPGYYYTSDITAEGYWETSLAEGTYDVIPFVYSDGALYACEVQGGVTLTCTVSGGQCTFNTGNTNPDPEPEEVVFTEVEAVYYGKYTKDENYSINLYTDDYATSGDDITAGAIFVFDINTKDAASVVGTYLFDNTNSGAAGTLGYRYSYFENKNGASRLSSGALTIVQEADGNYTLSYELVLEGNHTLVGNLKLPMSAYYQSNGKWYSKTLTNKVLTPITVAQARSVASARSTTDATKMSYLVEGVISSFVNTPAQIAQYHNARYRISDNGEASNELYCFSSYYLNNQQFVTGNEIVLGDTVAVFAPLMNYQGNTPELYYGYIYNHRQADKTIPSDEVLNKYKTAADQLVVAVKFLGEVCNDIVFTGSYNGWSTDVAKCAKFQPVTGYDNWYVVAVTDNSTDVRGKPVQLDNEGNFKWDYQTGDVDTWTVVRGSVNISAGYAGESDLTNYDKSSPVVLISNGWKTSPCGIVPKDYTIRLYAPTCATADYAPGIIGNFSNWEYNVPMTHVSGNLYTVTITATSGQSFKFREVNDTDWSNEILIYENGIWTYPANIIFGDETTITVDYSDGKWALCEEVWDFTKGQITYYGRYTMDENYEIKLFTSDYDGQGTGAVLYFDINTHSNSSIVGSYLLDVTNSGFAGTMGQYYSGLMTSETHTLTLTQGALTIIAAGEERYVLTYDIVLSDGKHMIDTLTLPMLACYYDNDDIWNYLPMSNQVITALPVGRALEMTTAMTSSNPTSIPYLVKGVITEMGNTAEQIAYYGNARFYISDSDEASYSMYCYNMRYLNNQNFKTGEEIAVTDTVAIYAKLVNYQLKTPELDYGYIYNHRQADKTIPSDAVLNSYKTDDDQLVLAVKFLGEVCNDIVFIGTYNNWNTDVTKCAKFQPVTGYDKWYVVAVTDTAEIIEGKPVQLDNNGEFNWSYQTGSTDTWTLVRGGVMITAGYSGESDLRNYDKSRPVVLISSGWKNSGSPCDVITKDYTINLYAPTCATANFQPAIIGDFNNWAYNVPMTHVGDNLYTVTVTANSDQYFKFREVNDTDWNNQILINIDGVWYYPADLLFGDAPTREVDYSNGKWQLCDEVDYNIYNLVASTDTVSTIYFQFESEAPRFYVNVELNHEIVVAGTIDYNTVKVSNMEEGTYNIWVYPMDENNNVLADAASVTVTLENWSVTDLQAWSNQDTIFFTVESKAPYCYVEIEDDETETMIINAILSDFSQMIYYLDEMPDGGYNVWAVALDETKTRTIGLWKMVDLIVNNTPTAVPTIQKNENPMWYDVLGRPLTSPQKGSIMIRRQGDAVRKTVNL